MSSQVLLFFFSSVSKKPSLFSTSDPFITLNPSMISATPDGKSRKKKKTKKKKISAIVIGASTVTSLVGSSYSIPRRGDRGQL